MADLAVTAANVVKGSNAKTEIGIFGATVTAGQSVYADPADSNKYKLADADSTTAAVRTTRGIALNGGANNQPAVIQTDGLITIGAAVAVGTVYAQSDVPGAIRPVADNGSGDYVTVLGIGVSASQIDLKIHPSGVALP